MEPLLFKPENHPISSNQKVSKETFGNLRPFDYNGGISEKTIANVYQELTTNGENEKMKTIFDLVKANDNKPLEAASLYEAQIVSSPTENHELMASVLSEHSLTQVNALLQDESKGYLISEKDTYGNNVSHIAALAKRPDVLATLQANSIDIFEVKNQLGVHPLHFSILFQDKPSVDYMLSSLGVGARNYLTRRVRVPGAKDREGKAVDFAPNFLEWAILFGHEDIVDTLLEHIHLEEAQGQENVVNGSRLGTLLHIAVRSNSMTLMHRLLEYDALRLLINTEDEQGVTPLGLSLLLSHLEMAELLVNYPNAEINHISAQQGWALIHWVIWELQLASLKFLLIHNVDVNKVSTDTLHEQPLAMAQRRVTDIEQKIALIPNSAEVEQRRELSNQKAKAERIRTAVSQPFITNPFLGTVRYFKSPEERRYTNLVLNGGGAKGILFPYALEHLQTVLGEKTKELDVLKGIQRVAGTSAGSIAALFIGLGCDAAKLQNELAELDVDNDILEGKSLFPVPGTSGKAKASEGDTTLGQILDNGKAFMGKLYDKVKMRVAQLGALANVTVQSGAILGDNFLAWVEKCIATQLGAQSVFEQDKWDGAITFREWHTLVERHRGKGFKHLYIVVTQLNPKVEPLILNTEFVRESDWYADVPIADAIRASMSIPLVFKPYQMRKRVNGVSRFQWPQVERTFVDGGLLLNYPLHEFDRAYYAEAGLRAPSQWSLGRRTYVNHNTLGLCLVPSAEDAALLSAPGNIKQLLERVISLYYNNEVLSNYREEDDKSRTVFLPCSEEVEEQGKKVKKEITTLDFHKLQDEEYITLAKRWSQKGVDDFLRRPTIDEQLKKKLQIVPQ